MENNSCADIVSQPDFSFETLKKIMGDLPERETFMGMNVIVSPFVPPNSIVIINPQIEQRVPLIREHDHESSFRLRWDGFYPWPDFQPEEYGPIWYNVACDDYVSSQPFEWWRKDTFWVWLFLFCVLTIFVVWFSYFVP